MPRLTNLYSRITPIHIFVILICILTTITLLSTLIAPLYFSFYSFAFSCDLFTFPFSCIILNIMTEIFGISQARSALWISYVIKLLAILLVSISQKLPTAPISPVTSFFFEQLLGGNASLQIAITSIEWGTKLIAIVFLEYMRKLINNQKMWLRHLCPTILAPFLTTLITLAYTVTISYPQDHTSHSMPPLSYHPILVSTMIQIIFGCLGMPLIYGFSYLIGKMGTMQSKK